MARCRVLSPCLLSSHHSPLRLLPLAYCCLFICTTRYLKLQLFKFSYKIALARSLRQFLQKTTPTQPAMAPRSRKGRASPSPASPASNGDTPPPPPSKEEQNASHKSSIDALLVPVSGEEHEEVKVNNASATDMKHACDDALKRVRPSLSLVYRFPRLRRSLRGTCHTPTTTAYTQWYRERTVEWVPLCTWARDPLAIATQSSSACNVPCVPGRIVPSASFLNRRSRAPFCAY